jgi:Gly-Xaa carboxypeptidase
VEKHVMAVSKALIPVAEKYDLTFDRCGTILHNGTEGTARIQLRSNTEPSPITPWNTPQWDRFSSAVVSAFGKDTIVSPSLSTANTDTKHYWNLSTNIMRWTPARLGTRFNAHTVNERIMLSTHMEGAKFFHGKCARELYSAPILG